MTEIPDYQPLARVPPTLEQRGTVIFLHGLGQSNVTWTHVVIEALAPHFPHILWLLPQSAAHPVSLNQGERRPSWFDIGHLPPHADEYDEIGIAESVGVIESLILGQVHAGIDPRRIVLVGFSQGAALALIVALTTLHELGGVASLSGWIPPAVREHMIYTEQNIPVFWGHGDADDEIPLEYGEDAVLFLRNNLHISNSRLCFRIYQGLNHGINDDELNELLLWLRDTLGR
ncbi:phospholipase carboxylesterase [Leucogyrophana mollusca]|uniref:Phospholipase carboxylesterase n=1 Tax=Leucogyrophana mollusca TaxID=85980 RepID=A0ACB8BTW3_9AGAM|nr:phospholipase carboxylesterase [Leucogyrophana mollusca]